MKIYEGNLVSKEIRIGIVVARFNEFITSKLLGGAVDGLKRHNVDENSIDVAWVPGAFEIPLIASLVKLRVILKDMLSGFRQIQVVLSIILFVSDLFHPLLIPQLLNHLRAGTPCLSKLLRQHSDRNPFVFPNVLDQVRFRLIEVILAILVRHRIIFCH